MASNAVSLHKKDESVMNLLNEALRTLDNADGEIVLDFSSVGRIDSGALRAIEQLADKAEQKNVKLVLRGVNVDIYKVLKLGRLDRRLAFIP